MTREDLRQTIHAATTLLVVPLRWTSPAGALWMGVGGVLLGFVVFPMLGVSRRVSREGGPWIDGAKLYPVAVLAALLLFPLPVAAAAWAVLGIGDAASNVVGRRFGRPPFLGRADRSLAGTLAFVATALPAAVAAHWWVAGSMAHNVLLPSAEVVAGAAVAAVAGAVAELLTPRWIDDNLPICLAAGAAMAVAMGTSWGPVFG
ncbi:MAG: hypothetical protein K8T90_05730 [Planctomycetes bacterium]|nr:hypothetical protein [Planctomycetota bacterium]